MTSSNTIISEYVTMLAYVSDQVCECECVCVELWSLKVSISRHTVHIFKSCLVKKSVLLLETEREREREGNIGHCGYDVLVSGPCVLAVSSSV